MLISFSFRSDGFMLLLNRFSQIFSLEAFSDSEVPCVFLQVCESFVDLGPGRKIALESIGNINSEVDGILLKKCFSILLRDGAFLPAALLHSEKVSLRTSLVVAFGVLPTISLVGMKSSCKLHFFWSTFFKLSYFCLTSPRIESTLA